MLVEMAGTSIFHPFSGSFLDLTDCVVISFAFTNFLGLKSYHVLILPKAMIIVIIDKCACYCLRVFCGTLISHYHPYLTFAKIVLNFLAKNFCPLYKSSLFFAFTLVQKLRAPDQKGPPAKYSTCNFIFKLVLWV